MTDESAATREPDQPPRQQRRGRRIAMAQPELDAFLAERRTCRVATASELGPHVTPLWYVKVTSWDFRMLLPAQPAQAQKTTS